MRDGGDHGCHEVGPNCCNFFRPALQLLTPPSRSGRRTSPGPFENLNSNGVSRKVETKSSSRSGERKIAVISESEAEDAANEENWTDNIVDDSEDDQVSSRDL